MSASNINFRCSSLGYIMTEARTKGQLGETCINHLVDKYVAVKYGRQTDIQTKYTAKGLMVEEDSITLYSRHKGEIFFKNENRLCNDFICGTPDLFKGEAIQNASLIIDVKSSWDIFTFFRQRAEKLNKNYYWQMQGYMALTGAETSTLVYCLINTPDVLITDEKRRLMWKMNVMEGDELFSEACEELDKLMIYDDIPMNERVIEIEILRNDEDIERIYSRVKECREYMDKHLFKLQLQEA